MKFWVTLILSLTLANQAFATFSLYYAVGPVFSTPGSIRAGINQWEVGLLSPGGVGIDKVFAMSEKNYMAFGPVMVISGDGAFGFYGSVGRKGKLFWGLSYRIELNSVFGFNGFSDGGGLAGISLDI